MKAPNLPSFFKNQGFKEFTFKPRYYNPNSRKNNNTGKKKKTIKFNKISNNDLIKKVLNWSYKMSLKDGLSKTYKWIESEMNQKGSNLNRFTKS